MATTMGASHGRELRCASCGLSYRYAPAKKFTCQNCGSEQLQDPRPVVGLGSVVGPLVPQDPMTEQMARIPIDLHAVHALMNSMSSDGLRQLHDRLSILHMVDEANRWRLEGNGEHYDQIYRALSGAGLRA